MRLHKDIVKVLVYFEWFVETLKAHCLDNEMNYEEMLEEMNDEKKVNEEAGNEFDRVNLVFMKAVFKYLDKYKDYKESSNYGVIARNFGVRMQKVLEKTSDRQEEEFFPLVFLLGIARWNDWSKLKDFDELKEIDFNKVMSDSKKEGCGNKIYMQVHAQAFKSYWEY